MTIKSIEIQWLQDETHCETCGWCYASGAEILVDGITAISMRPIAHCTGGADYPVDDVYQALLNYLAVELGFSYKETNR